MAKKRAFVKYTKAGELIPGSLIITTKGGYPKDGVYKEVDADLCCPPVCPECPPSPFNCTLIRLEGLPGRVGSLLSATVCGGTTNGDVDFNVGDEKCIQFYSGQYTDPSCVFVQVGTC